MGLTDVHNLGGLCGELECPMSTNALLFDTPPMRWTAFQIEYKPTAYLGFVCTTSALPLCPDRSKSFSSGRRLSKDFEQHIKNSEATSYWAFIQRRRRQVAPLPDRKKRTRDRLPMRRHDTWIGRILKRRTASVPICPMCEEIFLYAIAIVPILSPT